MSSRFNVPKKLSTQALSQQLPRPLKLHSMPCERRARLVGFRTTNVFKKVFDDVCQVMALKKKISARAMRRTFQDLAREANIDSIVQRSICGHATPEMSQLYSTVGQKEIQRAVGKVISISGYRELTLSGDPEYARSMQAQNGSSERQPEEPSDVPVGRLTN
jgi:hypothetical protein